MKQPSPIFCLYSYFPSKWMKSKQRLESSLIDIRPREVIKLATASIYTLFSYFHVSWSSFRTNNLFPRNVNKFASIIKNSRQLSLFLQWLHQYFITTIIISINWPNSLESFELRLLFSYSFPMQVVPIQPTKQSISVHLLLRLFVLFVPFSP